MRFDSATGGTFDFDPGTLDGFDAVIAVSDGHYFTYAALPGIAVECVSDAGRRPESDSELVVRMHESGGWSYDGFEAGRDVRAVLVLDMGVLAAYSHFADVRTDFAAIVAASSTPLVP